MSWNFKAIVLMCGLVTSPVAAFEHSFSCLIEKNKKILELSVTPTGVSYSYGSLGASPDLTLTAPIHEVKVSPWAESGRMLSYSVTVFNGEYGYSVYTTTDRVDQTKSAGVEVNKGQQRLATLSCDQKTVRGDLELLVMSLNEVHSRIIFARNSGLGADYFTESFIDTGRPAAITYRLPDESRWYNIHVSPLGRKAWIGFTVFNSSCVPSRTKLAKSIITVNKQKIRTVSACSSGANESDKPAYGYTVETSAGNEFIRDALMSNETIYVELGGEIIPFKSDGFSDAWKEANDPAL